MKRSVKKTWTVVAGLLAIAAAGGWWMHARQPATTAASAPAPVVVPPLKWPPQVRALAGDGRLGSRDGAAAQAQFADPYGLALDPHGTLYLSDDDRIRVLRTDGTVATLAGGGEGFADGSGAAARFDAPSGLALDAIGNL